MRTLVIAVVSALFFAYAVTELSMRLWPGQYLPLLLLAFVVLLLSGLLNLRLAGWLGAGARAQRAGSRGASRGQQRSRRARSGPREGRSGAREGARRHAPAAASEHADEPAAAAGPRETGTVKWFNRTKGFGFVIRESGEEIFVHQRSIRATGEGDNRRRPTLKDGQGVSFVVAEREKGLQAEDVVPVE